jgi:hypothetical protein
MKKQSIYSAPAVETIEVAIEAGIAQSSTGGGPGETPGVIYDPEDDYNI